MKKFVFCIFILFFVCSCNEHSRVNYTYEIKCSDADMSEYDDVGNNEHMFKDIIVTELFNCIDSKSSGIFYLGRSNCGCCQTCIGYMNSVALDLNVPIYYIDVYNKDLPLTDEELNDELKLYLFDILAEKDGEKILQTPIVFTVINGELTDSLICLEGINWNDGDPSDEAKKQLLDRYTKMFEPFSK